MEHLIEYKEMREAIVRVRELHQPIFTNAKSVALCDICENAYPCQTIKALDGEQ